MSVVNVKHNIIFIRVPRTASTSIGNVSFIGNGSHTTAIDIRNIIRRNLRGGLTYKEMFKFGFVRNPWDRLVSMCFYKKNYGTHAIDKESFSRYVEKMDRNNLKLWRMAQWRYLCDKHGRIIVDFVGRYEDLQEDWEKVCDFVGMYEDLEQHNMGKQLHYKEYYTDESREKVSELYREDIELFDYKYDVGGISF
ncbi:unnamed protein product [marine sediment metagenome]|uniref:Sulfotransferase domain-containing protein n=1 Tax=marine sediment metagenome TaxID=412755 RepID=X1C3U4_9ZZZZ